MTDDLVGLIERDDHARGCEGRWYACSCGYEARIEAGIRQAAARIEALEAARPRMTEDQVREMLCYDADTIIQTMQEWGFCHAD